MARMVKNHPADAGDIRDVGLIPESGGSPGGGHGNPLQYSCLENPMDRGTWWAIVHGSQRIGRNRSYSAHTHEGNISLPLVRKYNAVIYSITTFMVNNKDVNWLKTNIREGHILCNAIILNNCLFCSVQSLSRVWIFVTLWIAARQASLSITNSWSSLKLTSIKSVDAIQSSHPLSSPLPPAPNPSQHQSVFQWVKASHEVAKVLEFQL